MGDLCCGDVAPARSPHARAQGMEMEVRVRALGCVEVNAARLLLVFATRTMKNYDSIQL